jgi:hypothetical protein
MPYTRLTYVLVLVVTSVLPILTAAQEADHGSSGCGYCSVFRSFIAEATSRRDLYSLEKLKHDLQRMASICDTDRRHIERCLEDAITKTKAAQTPLNAFARRSASVAESGGFSLAADHAEPAKAPIMETTDAKDESPDEDQFEYCQRVISFATARRDAIAIENLEKRLPSLKRLTTSQLTQLHRLIRESRSTDIGVVEPQVFGRVEAGAPALPGTPAADLAATRMADEQVRMRSIDESSSIRLLTDAAPVPMASLLDSPVAVIPATGDTNSSLMLPAEASNAFSADYLRLRQRYLDFFFFQGMTATELDVKLTNGKLIVSKETVTKASFADQTLHMGQAMLAFAGEGRLLYSKGISSAPSEAAIKLLLDAFEKLDDADGTIYGNSKAGFFVRDAVHDGDRMGVPAEWAIKSDMQEAMAPGGNKTANAMSLDQATSLFVGWWGISTWSSDADNVARAKKQIDAVMNFLMDSHFLIRLPNGESIPNDRGPDFRYAAGFLCNIATRVTGKPYLLDANIDITIKGDPIRFRDDNLGEFEIPGYKIPASMPVALSHPAILGLKPIGLVGLTAPPKIAVRISDLIPDAVDDRELVLPCAHLEPVHTGGDTKRIPCAHFTAEHPAGDPGPTVPCTHVVTIHPEGDTVPCIHMTACHPGGDEGPVLPCLHLRKEHDHDWVEKTIEYPCPTPTNPGRKCKKTISTKIPCMHIGPEHPGGHPSKVPCVHLCPQHSGGHTVPCIHTKLAHDGHPTMIPCIHLVQAHPGGHDLTVPCIHIEQKHPAGHTFDLTELDIEIPLGEKLHSYSRHIALQCLAFEPTANGSVEFIPAALNSNHTWSALLRLHASGDVSRLLVAAKVASDLAAMKDANGLSSLTPVPWAKTNRWERCTDLQPDAGGPYAHNGLDFLSLEVLSRLSE